MLLRNSDLNKVRSGVFRCPTCGTYYDPTNGPCPGCATKRSYSLATISGAVVLLLFLLLWLPIEVAQAQMAPPPCAVNDGVVQCNYVYMPIGVK